jgi:hypothetical protein
MLYPERRNMLGGTREGRANALLRVFLVASRGSSRGDGVEDEVNSVRSRQGVQRAPTKQHGQ